MSNQTKYNDFRKTFPEFVYESYRYDVQSDGLHIVFTFRIGNDICFQPTAFIPTRPFLNFEQPTHAMDTLVFNMGMIELVSYWKCVCPPLVTVACGPLDEDQIAFWKKIYFNGLGEFFYINDIQTTIEDFMEIKSTYLSDVPNTVLIAPSSTPQASNHLVPIGGGKDSVVTLELLQKIAPDGSRPIPLIMNPRGATIGCIEAAGYTMDEVLVIKRTIHPKLLELNKEGCLNGHTPFSAMLAFYTLLAAQLSGVNNIALSNESSANEPTVAGTGVNHQYSKSLEFENDFRQYVQQHIATHYHYYSFLRPLSELQIAMLFSRFEHYYDVFRSCNAGSKQDIWCGNCPKCLFAYIILSPFIAPERLNQIFGKDMLNDLALKKYFDELTGIAATKPFECVGTISEVHSALNMTLTRWYSKQRPALLQDYKAMPPTTSLTTLFAEHNLTPDEETILHQAVKPIFRQEELATLLTGKKILIAGYGREGKSTERLLRRILPASQPHIAQNDEEIKACLKAATIQPYDLIIKSPGIPTMKLEGLCNLDTITSQTDLFLQVYGDKTIGVTGTKGKSTTTTLIHHVLRTNLPNQKVVLAGNMGIPLFDIIETLDEKSLVVAEFSCHQLENIHRAPHIGVVLNLYQEHLDHYHSYLDYKMAKMQMMLCQQADDHSFYCTDCEELNQLTNDIAPRCLSQLHPYCLNEAKLSGISQMNSPLRGSHNLSNAFVAAQVAKLFDINNEQYASALSTFHGLSHRLELVGTFNGITFYNDSISTIPEAAIAAIEALQEVDTLILGGFDRGIDYHPLYRYLSDPQTLGHAIQNLVFVGLAGQRMKREMEADGITLNAQNILVENDYAHIIDWCYSHTTYGKICLLSPAAASYDAFKNFEERGKCYKNLIVNHQIH